MRIAISSATSNPATPAPANTSSPGGAFQSILASASQQAPETPHHSSSPYSATGKQEEKQAPSSQSDNGSDASSTSQVEKDSPAAGTTSSQQPTNAASANSSSDVANGAPSNANASSTPSVAASVPLPPALAWLSSLNGQTATNSSQQGSDGAAGVGSKTASVSGTTVRPSAKQDKAQASVASGTAEALPTAVLLPSGAAAANSPSVQGNGMAGATAAAIHAASAAFELPHQVPNAQPAGAATQHAGAQANADQGVAADATTAASSQAASTLATPSAAEIFTLPNLTPAASGESNGGVSQSGGKTGSKDAAGVKNPDLAVATDASASKPAATGSSDASAQASQSSSQPVIHAQADPSQAVPATPKAADGSAPAAQALPIHGLAVETTHKGSDTPAAAPATGAQRGDSQLAASDSGDAGQASGINAARLIQSMGETEMRVGMRSTEFGDISIRTTVSQQQMLTQISLDHGDLSQAIAAHVSTVQAKLGSDYGLQASIQVHNQGSAFSGDTGQSSPREQKGYSSSTRIENFASPAESDSGSSLGPLVSAGDGYRLDIRA